jgi:hypothetical protein
MRIPAIFSALMLVAVTADAQSGVMGAPDRARAAVADANARTAEHDAEGAQGTSAPQQGTPADSAARAQQAQLPGTPPDSASQVTLTREVFQYVAGGRRDPFRSLIASGDLRPMISDLMISSITFDPTGRNSVAVMRDRTTKEQYRVRVGDRVGRMRVAAIERRAIVFDFEEFGFSRQERLLMGDPSTERTQ